jgi:hypothetical protein
MAVRTVLEDGPKSKKAVAFAIDWPGWSRGAKTPELAHGVLESYRERYRPVAEVAGMVDQFDAAGPLEVIEERVGTGSTDFWGISFSPSATETEPMDEDDLERKLTLLQACWSFFDEVVTTVSEEMQKGPRGGGRDRTQIYRHTVRVESEEFAKKVGVRIPEEGALEPDALHAYRADYLDAIREYNLGETKRMYKTWNLPFLIRHSAFHTMDHAWEMQDKDLTGAAP